MKRLFNREEGQSMVIVAVAIVVVLGFSAFGIDIGRVAIVKSHLQNIADSAALAGAQDLPSASTSTNTAIAYADSNGLKATQNGVTYDGDTITVTTPYNSDTKKIEVVCQRKVDYLFAQVLGFSSKVITARAVAQTIPAGGAAFDYAVFAGGGEVYFNGTSHVFGGSIYGRDGVTLGNKAIVYGDVVCTSSGTIDTGTGSVVNGTVTTNSSAISMPDFSELIKEQGIVCDSQSEFDALVNGKTVDGPIYVNGDVTISGRIQGNGIIYASGTITFANDTILQTESDHIVFYAAQGDITFNGGNGVNVGIIYAPNGTITVNGSPNSVTYGRLIAQNVIMNGAKGSIYAQDDDLEGLYTLSSIKLME